MWFSYDATQASRVATSITVLTDTNSFLVTLPNCLPMRVGDEVVCVRDNYLFVQTVGSGARVRIGSGEVDINIAATYVINEDAIIDTSQQYLDGFLAGSAGIVDAAEREGVWRRG